MRRVLPRMATRPLSACSNKDDAMGTQSDRRGEAGSRGATRRVSVSRRAAECLSPSEWARRTRIAQGLPAQVNDAVTLANIATIVRAGLRSVGLSGAPDGLKTSGVERATLLGPVNIDALQERADDASLLLRRQIRPRLADGGPAGKEIA